MFFDELVFSFAFHLGVPFRDGGRSSSAVEFDTDLVIGGGLGEGNGDGVCMAIAPEDEARDFGGVAEGERFFGWDVFVERLPLEGGSLLGGLKDLFDLLALGHEKAVMPFHVGGEEGARCEEGDERCDEQLWVGDMPFSERGFHETPAQVA